MLSQLPHGSDVLTVSLREVAGIEGHNPLHLLNLRTAELLIYATGRRRNITAAGTSLLLLDPCWRWLSIEANTPDGVW